MVKENVQNYLKFTPKTRNEIHKLVKKMCANYNRYYKCCPLLEDYSCYMLTVPYAKAGMCKYFETAVLPLAPGLADEIYNRGFQRCADCGKKITPTNGRQKYCPTCAVNARKKAAARRAKKFRQNRHRE